MNPKNAFSALGVLVRARLFHQRTPLIVSWAVTNRCNLECAYCDAQHASRKELTTAQMLAVLVELSRLGTQKIQFTGGEPLLRQDLGELIAACKGKGIHATVNSNGLLVEERIDALRQVDTLCLSLDGDEPAHDAVRGRGSYRGVIRAATLAKRNKIKLRFVTVLSSANLGFRDIDHVLGKALEYRAPVFFQPATTHLLMSKDPNPVAASPVEYQKALRYIADAKRKSRYLANSIDGLRHLSQWPAASPLRCLKGLVACRIESNGDVYLCPRTKERLSPRNCITDGYAIAFKHLPAYSCNACWCAANVELNLICRLRIGSIINAARYL